MDRKQELIAEMEKLHRELDGFMAGNFDGVTEGRPVTEEEIEVRQKTRARLQEIDQELATL